MEDKRERNPDWKQVTLEPDFRNLEKGKAAMENYNPAGLTFPEKY